MLFVLYALPGHVVLNVYEQLPVVNLATGNQQYISFDSLQLAVNTCFQDNVSHCVPTATQNLLNALKYTLGLWQYFILTSTAGSFVPVCSLH